jgi:Helicase HerA, central domain
MPDFFLGDRVDRDGGDRIEGDSVRYESADLTTHGVIVGMTGSGKTGLGLIFLEEALRSGIPTLVLDPKGDMTNLLLTFPELRPEDFAPWIDPGGATIEAAAADTAELWGDGLADWSLSGTDIAALQRAAGFTIYTPGSTAGVPLNVIGSLGPPDLDWQSEAEVLRDEIEGFTSGLLGLIGVEADPISSREHILIANLVEHAWREGRSLDMETLLESIRHPPLRKLGVFDVDEFFPEKDRTKLALQLNGLLASPSFAAWMSGAPLDMPWLLWDEDGTPQAAVIYLAHLTDQERQFVVALTLSRLITWMRGQPGSAELRVLTYMDEVFGFAPPTAQPPAKKPILTLMKQGRAFGAGMLLATQNPVDFDYKAMSNAGTWCIGRLQTERDKARIIEAMTSVTGTAAIDDLDATISRLQKRSFILHNVHAKQPELFTTRWAMCYLAGPLTRDQIAVANANAGAREPPARERSTDTEATQGTMMPTVASGVPVYHVDPAAPWLDVIGGDAKSNRYEAAIALRVSARFDEARAGLDHTEAWEAVYHPLSSTFDAAAGAAVDYDRRDFSAAPKTATYVAPDAPIDTSTYFRDVATDVKDHLYETASMTVYRNPKLKLYSRIGETRQDFEARARRAAEDTADAEIARLRSGYARRIERAKRDLDDAVERANAADRDAAIERGDAALRQVGAVFDLFTGKGSAKKVLTSSRSTSGVQRRQDKARQKVDTASATILELEDDLADALEEIVERWAEQAATIEEIEVGLERDDIDVDELALVWVPRP